MADFVQTMKDWRRMCQFMDKEYGNSSCDNCPLGGCSAVYEMCGKENFSNMQHDIAAWAAEHPAPVYPTWFEWLEQEGVTGRAYEHNPYFTGDKEIYMRTAALTPKAFEPIPADIAKKLGIEPKEGV